jgi:cytochrome-b5 reductase
MREDLDSLSHEFPDRLIVTYSLTADTVPEAWDGFTGRGDQKMIRAALPPPTGDGSTMIFVCGTDGFVETWGGPVGRAKTSDGSKGRKVQGPLTGLLAEAGYQATEVFKY